MNKAKCIGFSWPNTFISMYICTVIHCTLYAILTMQRVQVNFWPLLSEPLTLWGLIFERVFIDTLILHISVIHLFLLWSDIWESILIKKMVNIYSRSFVRKIGRNILKGCQEQKNGAIILFFKRLLMPLTSILPFLMSSKMTLDILFYNPKLAQNTNKCRLFWVISENSIT